MLLKMRGCSLISLHVVPFVLELASAFDGVKMTWLAVALIVAVARLLLTSFN
jgi:hypothetical protein